tara:strand:+ start:615 stop:1511 length:897 start_codon:yes stop_codon:yes gene_type:complete
MNWIIVTIFAAFFQNLRSSIQKNLNKEVSTIASTYVRFAFALPFATILFFIYFRNFEIIKEILIQDNFIIFLLLGSLSQIIFTFILLYLFKFSNFMVGTSLSKTEVIQIAILEFFILKEKLNILGASGIVISTLGIIILSIKDAKLFFKNLISKTTLVGLLSGFFLALSVVYFRAAALSLNNFESNFEKALSTLFFGLFVQTIVLTIYIFIFEKNQFTKLYKNKFESLLAGIAGFLATISWFYAFTLVQSSFVRALGQVEIIFSFISSRYYFKEKIKLNEIIGVIIFIIGILILLLLK